MDTRQWMAVGRRAVISAAALALLLVAMMFSVGVDSPLFRETLHAGRIAFPAIVVAAVLLEIVSQWRARPESIKVR